MKESNLATWLMMIRTGDKAHNLSIIESLVSIEELVDVGMAML